jgi:hypothetical protein
MGRMSDMEISIEELVKENELLVEANEELKAEVARLERLYAIASEPKLLSSELGPGGSLRMGLEPCIGAKVLAASFSDMLGDAKNWRCVEVGPFDSDRGSLVVTVRRSDGETPEFQVAEARKEVAELKAALVKYNPNFDCDCENTQNASEL